MISSIFLFFNYMFTVWLNVLLNVT